MDRRKKEREKEERISQIGKKCCPYLGLRAKRDLCALCCKDGLERRTEPSDKWREFVPQSINLNYIL